MDDGDWIESKDQDPNGDVRLIQLADIGDGQFIDKSSRFMTSVKASELRCTYLRPGDVLIARMPDPLGRSCIFPDIGMPSVTAVDVCIWRAAPETVDARWLMHFLNSPEVRDAIQSQASGTTRQRVSGGNLKRLPVRVPPAQEQRRIVAKLEPLRARSSRVRHELDRIPKLIDRYRQAILAKLYDEAAENAEVIATLGDLALEVRNGLSRKPEQTLPGVPILRISAVRPGLVRLDQPRFYRLADGENIESYILRNGDLLFTRYNGNPDFVAVCGLLRGLDESIVYPDKLIRIRVDEAQVLPDFVELIAQAPQSRRQLAPFIKTAAGQHGISGKDLQTLSVPTPSLAIQATLIAKARTAFSWLDKIATEHARANHLLPKLDRAILAKAFRGELVPQDPNDEPASVLLERIKAERGDNNQTRRRRARNA
jgi:type I restriction enzyme S subunit